LMGKHLIDTDLYIDLIQSGATLPLIRELYEKDAGLYFSSIVVQELLAGVRNPAAKRRVESLFRPFERTGRIVTRLTANGRKRERYCPRFSVFGPS
jgi:predicted nucleic acid-binding protein